MNAQKIVCFSLLTIPLLAACSKAEPAAATSSPPQASNTDRRDQYALIADLDRVLESPAAEQARRYNEIKSDWQGRRYRWELFIMPSLCARADSCFAIGFDYARSNKRIIQGWLPRLELDLATYEKIRKSCEPHAGCVIEVEAKMTRLIASPELPTSVSLGEISLLGFRDAKPTESWGRAPTS